VADPIPTEEIAVGLDLAVTLGVLRRWTVIRFETGVRRFRLYYPTGEVIDQTPSIADAFATAVSETAAALNGAKR
jgi:hypothetical protein